MPNGDITDAQDFFAFYVKGVDIPNTAPRSFPGIRRRTPAVVSQAPEYDPVPDDDDGSLQTDSTLLADAQNVASGSPARAASILNPQRCVQRDICGLEDVIVQTSATPWGYEMVFLWCTDYPASQFPNDGVANPPGALASDGAGRVFTLNASDQSELVLAECVTRFLGFVGAALDSTILTARTVPFSFELLGQVRAQVGGGSL